MEPEHRQNHPRQAETAICCIFFNLLEEAGAHERTFDSGVQDLKPKTAKH